MKKSNIIKISGCSIVFALAFMLGCDKYSEFKITEKPYVNKTSVVLLVGEGAGERSRIQLVYSPFNRQYTWTSDVPEVATTDQNGLITAHSEGFAVITVASKNDFTTVNVQVKEFVAITDLLLNKTEFTGYEGDRIQAVVTVEPANATDADQPVQWISSNENVAVVSNTGLITFVNDGDCNVIASIGDFSKTIRVYSPTVLLLDKTVFPGSADDQLQISGTIRPSTGTSVVIQWTSSDETVATVSDGLITIANEGECIVTATAGEYSNTVKVCAPIKLPRNVWTVPGYVPNSNSQTIGYSSQHGGYTIMNMFDNNAATFWHANYSAPVSDYPHWFIVDMGENAIISHVMLQRRQTFVSVNGFYFYTCPDVSVNQNDPVDGYPWELQGEYEFNPNIDAEQLFKVPNFPKARYLKMYFDRNHRTPGSPNTYAQIGEFAVWGGIIGR